ncbi:TonB protein [Azotobacter vinelandii CA]|uniref:Protein TonB n=2 Tax=Azotobacter vinelandii TaxID=354 RepID=C1DNS6_AZOVD|nr:energy transducer TonB [Azotobacter vinelandii]ACO77292.1 TonB protein [Azotobacter vinelandii DJ]AGK14032.1 TonB protein [Azotobacter vinelandii CA]AGK18877.1 TonB protein [Azotobacter vinelandii CA6]WKN22970.1 energy transducer TonB [Azotobacter vinelandii]SFX62557.1 outer membrane transport energization protein TonB [Azotobacter vinelandii]
MSEQLRVLPRWGLCLLLVLGLHVGIALWSLYWRPESKPIQLAPPPPAMMVDLAPAAAPAAAAAAAAAPPPPTAEPEPEPEAQPDMLAQAKPIEAPKPKLALPPPKPKQKEKPKPKPKTEAKREQKKPDPKQEQKQEQKQDAEPQQQVAQSQAQGNAAAAGASNAADSNAKPAGQMGTPGSSNAMPTWQGILRAHLSRYKRYPPESRRRGDEGTVTLRFKIDGQGRLLSYELVARSGRIALDQATLQMIRRAEPLPPPPAELLTNGTLEVVAPFAYSLRDR